MSVPFEAPGNLKDIRAWLERANEKPTLSREPKEVKSEWVGQVLDQFGYAGLSKSQKGLIRTYLQRVTGYSRAQVQRLIAAHLPRQTVAEPLADVLPAAAHRSKAQPVGIRDMLGHPATLALTLLIVVSLLPSVLSYTAAPTGSNQAASSSSAASLAASEKSSVNSRTIVLVQSGVSSSASSAAPVTKMPDWIGDRVQITTVDLRMARSNTLRLASNSFGSGRDGMVLTLVKGKAVWQDPYNSATFDDFQKRPGSGRLPFTDSSARRYGGGGGSNSSGSSGTSSTSTTSGISQGTADGLYVNVAGDTMAGALVITYDGLGLNVTGTISGATIHAEQKLTVSGTTVFDGNARFNSTVTISGVTYSFPGGDGASSGKVLKTNGAGQLSWADDDAVGTGLSQASGDARYLRLSGGTLTGLTIVDITNGNFNTVGLKVINTLSGAHLHAERTLSTSGSLVFEGAASGATLYVATSINGAGLTDCDLTTSTLRWDSTTGRFSCGTATNNGFGTGNVLTIGDARYVNQSGDTMTGALLVKGNLSGSRLIISEYAAISGSLLAVGNITTRGVLSGHGLTVGGSASITGTLLVLNGITSKATVSGSNLYAAKSITGTHLYVAQTFGGAGLADCDTAGTSKLLWDSTTKKFSCGTDFNVGTFGTGNVLTIGDARYLKRSGGTMTGQLIVDITGGDFNTVGLKVINTLSGAHVHAERTLSSSGSFSLEGTGTLMGAVTIGGGNSFDDLISGKAVFRVREAAGGDTLTFSSGNGLSAQQGGVTMRFMPDHGSNRGVVGTYESVPLAFFVGNAEQARIDISGNLGIGTSSPKARLDVIGTVSGARLSISNNANISGALLVIGNVTTRGTLSGNILHAEKQITASGGIISETSVSGSTLLGFGLGSCNGSNSKVVYNNSTNQFSCATDQTGGSGTFGTGNVLTIGDARYVNQSGDTMTGVLVINDSGSASGGVLLNVLGTISGRVIKAQNLLVSSGAIIGESSLLLNRPHTAASNAVRFFTTDTEIWQVGQTSDGTNHFKIRDVGLSNDVVTVEQDTPADTLYLQKLLNGSAVGAVGIGTDAAKAKLDVVGSISGARLTISGIVNISGALLAVNNITTRGTLSGHNLTVDSSASVSGTLLVRTSITSKGSVSGATLLGFGLGSCNGSNSKVVYNNSTNQFSCATDQTGGSGTFGTGNVLTIGDARYVNQSGDTMTGALLVKGNLSGSRLIISENASISGALLVINNITTRGVLSGHGLTVGGSASITGTLIVLNNITSKATVSGSNLYAARSITGSHLYAAATFNGAGLADCDTAGTSKLLWDSTTKRFSCGTDFNVGTFGTGNVLTIGDARYVNQSGDTMTGVLIINDSGSSSGGVLLNVAGTMSGRSLYISGSGGSTAPLLFANSLNGRVGVGTSLPKLPLSVRGVTSSPAITGTVPNGIATFGTSNDTDLYLGSYTGATGFWMQVQNAGALGTTFPLILNPDGGNVGIGTNAPANNLDVSYSNGGNNTNGITITNRSTSGYGGSLIFKSGRAGGYSLSKIDSENSVSDGGVMRFYTANTSQALVERAVIDQVGNLGIGTTAPKAKLDVVGTISGSRLSISNDATISGSLIVGRTGGFNTIGLKVLNTLSGAHLHAERILTTSGSLVWEGAASGATLYVATSINGAGLTDCDLTTSTLRWDSTTGRFSCGTATNNGFGTGNVLTIADARYVNQSGDTMTGSLIVQATMSGRHLIVSQTASFSGAVIFASNVRIRGTLSGNILHAEKQITASGGIISETSVSGSTLLGFGLGSCSAGSSKVVYNNSTNQFGCATDQTVGNAPTSVNTGGVLQLGDQRYLKLSGGTLTGVTTVNITNGNLNTIGLKIINALSGATIHAERTLSSSGIVVIETATNLRGSGALSVVQNAEFGTGAYLYSSGTVLALDTYSHLGFDKHILFGYRGHFDTNLYRSDISTLRTDGSLIVLSSISGSRLTLSGNANISGTLLVLNGVTSKATVSGSNLYAARSITGSHLYAAQTFNGAGLADCDAAGTSKLLWDSTTKRFSCGTDQTGGPSVNTGGVLQLGDARYVKKSGDTMTGVLIINDSGSASGGVLLNVLGAMSGRSIYVSGTGASTRPLLSADVSKGRLGIGTSAPIALLHLSGSGASGGAQFGMLIDQTSTGDAALSFRIPGNGQFIFGMDNSDDRKLKIANGSDFGALDILTIDKSVEVTGRVGIITSTPKTQFDVRGTISGSRLIVSNNANISGSLLVMNNIVARGSVSGSTINGFGLGSCSAGSSKVVYNNSTNQFGCATDQTVGNAPTSVNTGGVLQLGDARYVNVSGDTMTGVLIINDSGSSSGGVVLNVQGTMSGRSLWISGTGAALKPLLMTDVSLGRIGIGTATPRAKLSLGVSAANTSLFDLYDGGVTSRTGFGVQNSEIQFYMPSTNHFSFGTGGALQTSGAAEIMRIHGDGTVSVGTVDSVGKFLIQDEADPSLLINAGWNATANPSLQLGDRAQGARGQISYDYTDGGLLFGVSPSGNLSPTEVLRLQRGGNVGIGTASPEAKLEVVGTVSGSRLIVSNNANISGALLVRRNISGSGTLFLESGAYIGGSTLVIMAGTGHIGIGTSTPDKRLDIKISSEAGVAFQVQTKSEAVRGGYYIDSITNIASFGSTTNSDAGLFVFGQTAGLILHRSGNVGIGTITPKGKLVVTGSGTFTGTISGASLQVNGGVRVGVFSAATATTVCRTGSGFLAACSSSLRYKEDVQDLNMGLSTLARMRPVNFKWQGRNDRDFGFIAEEMEAINPLFVEYDNEGRVQGVKYMQLTAVLTNAVKELDYRTLGLSGSSLSRTDILSGSGALRISFGTGVLLRSLATDGRTDLWTIKSDVGGTGNTVLRINASGAVFSDSTFNSQGADYAEWFLDGSLTPGPSPEGRGEALKAGEVVCIDILNSNTVRRCERGADPNVMGIVSTHPAFVGNAIKGANGMQGVSGYALIGLIGQVPARVDLTGGQVRPGDSLTASSTPGFARRALAGESTVGVALEAYDESLVSYDAEGRAYVTINVLISRRNQSLTVETVEQKVLDSIASMNISDEVSRLVQTASDQLNVDARISSAVSLQLQALDLAPTVNALIDRRLSGATLNFDQSDLSLDLSAFGSGLTLIQSEIADLKSRLTLIEAQIASGSLRFGSGQALHAAAATFSGLTVLGSHASIGPITVSGSAVEIGSLMSTGSLKVLGNITVTGLAQFFGDVKISGQLILSGRQAGHAVIPASGTSVTVLFNEPMAGTPIVTATPDVPVLFAVSKVTSTGFTIRISPAATETITFAFLAISAEDPRLVYGTGSTAIEAEPIAFPVNEYGHPLSTDVIWNSCIRGTPILLSTGEPVSCARYHDGYVWQHPDLGIFFTYNPNHEPPILTLPEGYAAEVVADEESEELEAIEASEGETEETEETNETEEDSSSSASSESSVSSSENSSSSSASSESSSMSSSESSSVSSHSSVSSVSSSASTVSSESSSSESSSASSVSEAPAPEAPAPDEVPPPVESADPAPAPTEGE